MRILALVATLFMVVGCASRKHTVVCIYPEKPIPVYEVK